MNGIESTFGIGKLIAQQLTGALSDADQQELDAWLMEDPEHTAIFNRIVAHENLAAALLEMQQVNTEMALKNVKSRMVPAEPRSSVKLWPRIALAAAAVAAIVFGVWFYTSRHPDTGQDPASAQYATDIVPGKNTATLTLANGSIIQLSDAKTGLVINAMKDATQLTYNDGSLVRSSLRGGTTRQPHDDGEMLTASTPRGGTYQFTLPDGTKVWLNAQSKLSFPSKFSSNQRLVKLEGEAYFEVVKLVAPATVEVAMARGGRLRNDVRVSFIVETKQQEVTVLGTHFNINAYADEAVTKTTLLEGSVKVSVSSSPASSLRRGSKAVTLAPNQQAINTGSAIKVANVPAESFTDWKSGEFYFRKEGLQSIMRKLSRWYDVQVEYGPGMENDQRQFSGTLSRFDNISKVLGAIEKSVGLKFEVDGRKVKVLK